MATVSDKTVLCPLHRLGETLRESELARSALRVRVWALRRLRDGIDRRLARLGEAAQETRVRE
jgi:hypothetical protein